VRINIHRARRLALQGLCCLDARNGEDVLVETFLRDSREPNDIVEKAMEIFRAVWEAKADCDQLLSRHARRWDLGRLALVDRNILRLGAWELRKGKTPFKVIISEAIKLAREFSTAESPRFVNGVLDAIAKDLQCDTKEEPSE
jgi:transcription antitermination factor NusB